MCGLSARVQWLLQLQNDYRNKMFSCAAHIKCTASIYSEYFTSTSHVYPGKGLGEKALESRRTNGMSIYCTTTIHCAFIRKET